MILQCPNCHTQFNVPDGAIPAAGRKVKCANCDHKWHATPDSAVQPSAPPQNYRPRPDQAKPAGQRRRRRAPYAQPHPATPRGGMPSQGMSRQGMSRQGTLQQAPVQPAPPQRPEPAFVAPNDLREDAAFAAKHASVRAELAGGANQSTVAPSPTSFDEDPFAEGQSSSSGTSLKSGTSVRNDFEDDFSKAGSADFASDFGDGTQDDLDDSDDYEGDGLDFMSKIRAGAGDLADASLEGAAKESIVARLLSKVPSLEGLRERAFQVAWGSLALLWIIVITGILFMGEAIQAAWPPANAIYSSMHSMSDVERLKAEADSLSAAVTEAPRLIEVGLASDIEQPYRWDVVDGENHLVLMLVVSNKGRRAATVPQLRVSFLNAQNQLLNSWTVNPPGKILTRGSFLSFEVSRADYPAGIANIVITEIEGSQTSGEADTSNLY